MRILNATSGDVSSVVAALDVAKQLQRHLLRLKGEFMNDDGTHVDYEGMRASEQFAQYCHDCKSLTAVNLEALGGPDSDEKKCFFLNIYNSLTIHGLATLETVPKSVLDVENFWKTTAYNIAGHTLTLDEIEHGILRGNREHPSDKTRPFALETDARAALACAHPDPRVHFALVCGAKSCPPIRVFTPLNLERALDAATANFCRQEVLYDASTRTVSLNKILQWYASDFGATLNDLLRFVAPHLDEPVRTELTSALDSGDPITAVYRDYDWSLNGK